MRDLFYRWLWLCVKEQNVIMYFRMMVPVNQTSIMVQRSICQNVQSFLSFWLLITLGLTVHFLYVIYMLTAQKKFLPWFLIYQNTYTNADKLLEAAEQLAQTGECDPEEIYKAARHLEVRIQDFVRRVEQRKLLLDMSVSFHTHTKEVNLPFSLNMH